ncbi:FeoB-associated Cys-rich membrane protein [Desulfosarcina sp.]|uniref:FeoB-associated Cys-rich membrane protein n=1 Tax=Desulfosarcina sp. TaxID=2027861 RepID=UPI003568E571
MEILIVILIVAAAAFYVGRIFYKGFKQKDGCSCGCTCCSVSDSCSQPAAGSAADPVPVEKDR